MTGRAEWLRRQLTERGRASSWVAGLLVVAGFAVFLLGWRGAAARSAVALQLPFVVSSGLTGFGLIVLGLGLLWVQATRRHAARERRLIEAMVSSARYEDG